jgi:arylsulfatase A-like enzyme
MNVIIIKTDQQWYDTLGCMGHPLVRAQVLIGFAAVAVTTTGFSGRLIAGTNL